MRRRVLCVLNSPKAVLPVIEFNRDIIPISIPYLKLEYVSQLWFSFGNILSSIFTCIMTFHFFFFLGHQNSSTDFKFKIFTKKQFFKKYFRYITWKKNRLENFMSQLFKITFLFFGGKTFSKLLLNLTWNLKKKKLKSCTYVFSFE